MTVLQQANGSIPPTLPTFDQIEKEMGVWWSIHIYAFPSLFLIALLILLWRLFKTRNFYGDSAELVEHRARVSFKNYPNCIRMASSWVCFSRTLILFMNPYLTKNFGDIEWLRLTWVSTFPFVVGSSLMLVMFSAEVGMIYARARPLTEPKHLFVIFSMLFFGTFCIVGDILNLFEVPAGQVTKHGQIAPGTDGAFATTNQAVLFFIYLCMMCLFFAQAFMLFKRMRKLKYTLNPTPSMAPLMVEEGGDYPLSKKIAIKQLRWFVLHMVINGVVYALYCGGYIYGFINDKVVIELNPRFTINARDAVNFKKWYIEVSIHRLLELIVIASANWSAEFVNYGLLYNALLHKNAIEQTKTGVDMYDEGSSGDIFYRTAKDEKKQNATKERTPAENTLKEQIRMGTQANKVLENVIANYSARGSFKLEKLEGQEKELIPSKWREEGIELTVQEGYDEDD